MANFFDDPEFLGNATEDEEELKGKNSTGYYLKRELYQAKDGNKYWLFYTEGVMRGHSAKVNFTAAKKDRVSYEQLSFIFSVYDGEPVPLYYADSSFVGSDGKKVETTRYFVEYTEDDELGGTMQILLRPKNESDKAFWSFFMQRVRKERELAVAAANARMGTVAGEPLPEEAAAPSGGDKKAIHKDLKKE